MDEADCDIGHSLGWPRVDVLAIGLVGFEFVATELVDEESFFGILIPDFLVSSAKVILVVDEEFFQARTSNVRELDFHFCRGFGCFASLRNILFSRTGGLYHLIDGPISSAEKAFAEMIGEIVDDLGFSIG